MKENLVGRIFERLTVLSYDGNGMWLCQCSCDKKTVKLVKTHNLNIGKVKSCGCISAKPQNNLIGKVFGLLTVISYIPKKGWLCKCGCENKTEIILKAGPLLNGHKKSCGCLYRGAIPKHGMCTSSEYKTWKNMKTRCDNPKNRHYHNYGGRGITYCERWKIFENFYEDMGEKPEPKEDYSIDRVDNNLGYYKENCKWSTSKEQQNNKRCNIKISYKDEIMSIEDWSKETGISSKMISYRYNKGWSAEKILTTPYKPRIKE